MTYVNMWLHQQLYRIFSTLNFLFRVPDSQTVVSDLLDAYGYAIFFSPFIAALPGFIFKAISFFTKSRVKGDFYGYLSIQTVVVILSSEWLRNNVIIYLLKYYEINTWLLSELCHKRHFHFKCVTRQKTSMILLML